MPRNRPHSLDDGAADLATAVLTASRVLVGVSARSLSGVEETLTLPQFRTLVVLSSQGGCTLRVLAEELGVTASSALRMVDRLVESDLVVRSGNPDDRRAVVLDLSEEGTAVVEQVTATRRHEIADIVQKMPATHQAWLVSALHSFAQAAGEPVVASDRW